MHGYPTCSMGVAQWGGEGLAYFSNSCYLSSSSTNSTSSKSIRASLAIHQSTISKQTKGGKWVKLVEVG